MLLNELLPNCRATVVNEPSNVWPCAWMQKKSTSTQKSVLITSAFMWLQTDGFFHCSCRPPNFALSFSEKNESVFPTWLYFLTTKQKRWTVATKWSVCGPHPSRFEEGTFKNKLDVCSGFLQGTAASFSLWDEADPWELAQGATVCLFRLPNCLWRCHKPIGFGCRINKVNVGAPKLGLLAALLVLRLLSTSAFQKD